jgi:hypothetical protein
MNLFKRNFSARARNFPLLSLQAKVYKGKGGGESGSIPFNSIPQSFI